MAAIGVTKPAAGVMATSPDTPPEAAPNTVGLPRCIISTSTQPTIPTAAEICVVNTALAARKPTPRADPALKPNHPNHRIAAPRIVIGKWCGSIGMRP